MNPVAPNLIKKGVFTLGGFNSSLFVSSSDDAFFSEGLQPYSYKPRFAKAPVIYDGKHGLDEGTDDQEELAERICNINCLK